MNENVTCGIHPNAREIITASFSQKEREIAQYWGSEWYITNAGSIDLGQSEYKFFLIKPTLTYEEALSLSREIITIFYKGIMPSEKILDLPVDCNTLTGSVNL